jgi:N-acetylmuramoyl-L-alanine amidase
MFGREEQFICELAKLPAMLRAHRRAGLCAAVILAPCLVQVAAAQSRVDAIRFWSFGDVTRIAIETEGEYKLASDQIPNPYRLYFDLNGLRPPSSAHRGMQTIAVNDRRVKEIRVAEVSPGKTRIVFDLEGPVDVVSSQLVNPDRLMIEIRPKGGDVPALSLGHSATGSQKVDLSCAEPAKAACSAPDTGKAADPLMSHPGTHPLPNPEPSSVTPALPPIIAVPAPDDHSKPDPAETNPGDAPAGSHENAVTTVETRGIGAAAPAKSDSSGDRSLVRVFGLKFDRVVIDAGHGGHDTGTIGPNGLMEKDLVLDVALRLGKLIRKTLGADVVYTRSSDVFVPLEDRTKIANNEKADLFISIHANSSPEKSATGVETYYFNLTSDKRGLDLASRENATSVSSISDLNDLLHKAVLQTKLEESREFAQRVQTSLWTASLRLNNRSKDRGVRQAPFVVLIGATMPSILAEVGFVSNPHDARLLKRSDQRQRIAEALFKGISQYANTLSHTQLARATSGSTKASARGAP